jgi:PAS domain S-box-containing protein
MARTPSEGTIASGQHQDEELRGLRQRLADLETRLVEVNDLAATVESLRSEQARQREVCGTLARSRDRYRELFDFGPIPCLRLDPHGVILSANLRAAALLGRTRKALEGVPLRRFVDPQCHAVLLAHLRLCRTCELPVRAELTLASAEMGPMPVEIHSHRLPGDGLVILSSLTDLSDRRRAEEARQRMAEIRAAAQANDRVISTVSHELRGPLTALINLVEALKLTPGLPPRYQPIIEAMERSLWQQVRLVDDLLDAGRIARHKLKLELEELDLSLLLRELAADLGGELHEAGIVLDLAAAADSHRLRGDPVRLRQVFFNLLSNAKKFTPAGGRVTLRTRSLSSGWLEVSVQDTGSGIEGKQITRLFEPFVQVEDGHKGGLGLGLAIAKGLVEAHGGTLAAHSKGRGKGATFIVTLPRAGPALEEGRHPS